MFSVLNRIGRVQGDEKIDQKKKPLDVTFLKTVFPCKGSEKIDFFEYH